MRKVLILGGTRFFGRKLVERLLTAGDEVTIVTRGALPSSFHGHVRHAQADRKDYVALRRALGDTTYDVVYDNICYLPQEAEEAVKLFAGRAGKYVVTSSLSVYPYGEPRKTEAMFDAHGYALPNPFPSEIDYGEGKRLIEAVFLQRAPFPVATVRFPIVLGADDYTRRLHFHVEHVKQGLPLGIPVPDARMSFIHADEAAAFLFWLGHSSADGAFNACSHGEITPAGIVSLIEGATGKEAHVAVETAQPHMSPFGIPSSWYMDTSKAEATGFLFWELNEWLPQLITQLAQEA